MVIIFAGYRELATNRLHSVFHVLEIHDHVRFEDAFALHLVELPRIDDPDALAGALPAVRRWARFLGAHTDEERSEVAKDDPMVSEAQTILEELSSIELTTADRARVLACRDLSVLDELLVAD